LSYHGLVLLFLLLFDIGKIICKIW
jgi:hypothetical protein